MILPWPITTNANVINVQCLFSNSVFGSKISRAKTAEHLRAQDTSDSVFHSYCLLINVFKWQSNTKFCNQLYRNLLSNGALTFLFGDASDGFYFTLFPYHATYQIYRMNCTWWKTYFIDIVFFMNPEQNIPIYKIRVESMEQTILLFYRYNILFYSNSSATKNHTNPRDARERPFETYYMSNKNDCTTISVVIYLLRLTFVSFCSIPLYSY